MNKVINIEIAGQVFWIEKKAYGVLLAYLQKIQKQLTSDESASEIFRDIELRIAELLYAQNSHERKAIDLTLTEKVIEQVGYIDNEDINAPLSQKSYLDQQNKILGGVCAGLALRLNVSAFILRLVFVALTALFGLGIVLYLIFWFSLDTNNNHKAALNRQNKTKAESDKHKEGFFMRLQRIIFLPVSILGTLITVIGHHFKKRSKGYSFIIKNLLTIVLLILSFFFFIGLFEFNHSRVFTWPISWGLSLAAMYLVVLAWTTYIRKYYFRKPHVKINKKLKIGALIPAVIIISATLFVMYSHSAYQHETQVKNFTLNGQELFLKFNEQRPQGWYINRVRYKVKTSNSVNNDLIVHINYSSNGSNNENAIANIHKINYFFTFDNKTLELDQNWSLPKDILNRNQQVDVILEVPQNTVVSSNWALNIDQDAAPYYYNTSGKSAEDKVYLSQTEYLYDYHKDFKNTLSHNEIKVLKDKFCETFFIHEPWGCPSNIQNPLSTNRRFDRAYQKEIKVIEQLRQSLLPNRSFFVSHLTEMNEQVKKLTLKYPVIAPFQAYIENVLTIKSNL